jgi:hypothetical protein
LVLRRSEQKKLNDTGGVDAPFFMRYNNQVIDSHYMVMSSTVSSSVNNEARIDVCQELVKRINAGDFDSSEVEELALINDMTFLQIREETSLSHIREIAEKIDEVNGDISNTDPVLIWEEASDDGKDIGGDGNHTRQGITLSKHASEVKTRRISKEVWTDLGITKQEMIMVGVMLNRVNPKKKLENSDGTHIKQLLSYHADGHELNSNYCHEALKAFGIVTKKKRDHLIKKAAEKDFNERANQSGKTVKIYGKGAPASNNDRLYKKVEQLRDNKTMVVYGSTGASKTLETNITSQLIDDEVNGSKYKLALVIYHNKFEFKDQWEKNECSEFVTKIKKILKKMGPVKVKMEDGGEIFYEYQFEIYEMPFLEDDGSSVIKTQ